MSGNIRDTAISLMRKEYERFTKKDAPFLTAILQNTPVLHWGDFKRMQTETGYKIKVRDIVPIKNEIINFVCLSDGMNKKQLNMNFRTGIYRIVFENDMIVMLACYFGWRNETHSLLMGTEEALAMAYNNQQEKNYKQESPKPGVFSIETLDVRVNGRQKTVVLFNKAEWIFNAKPVHPAIADMVNDIEYFFAHPKEFAMYGQVPFRKLFTIGPPGTGKSSINFYLARMFSEKITTIFSTNLNDIYHVMKLAAKHKKPLLVFFDDAESLLSVGRVSSELLNFLSGSLTPNNPAGVVVVFTSNMTDWIEDRILKRPGRIDRIFHVGILTGKYALECARMYLNSVYKVKDEDVKVFEKMTGAEIQGLMQYAVITANFHKTPIDIELIKQAKELMMQDLNKAKDMMNENSMVQRTFPEKKKVGFTTTNRPLQQIENDRF